MADVVQPKSDDIITSPTKVKEQEPASQAQEEEEIMVEIKSTAEALDEQALEKVREEVEEARGMPEPQLPPEVKNAGVYAPVVKAEEVVKSGATIDLPVSEEEYKKGLHQKVAGVVVDKVVVGVSSLAGLALFVGRLIKMVHKHAMRVIFKKGGSS